MKRAYVEAFNTVIEHLVQAYPAYWPEDKRETLIEEAKQPLRDRPEELGPWFVETAQRIKETGSWE